MTAGARTAHAARRTHPIPRRSRPRGLRAARASLETAFKFSRKLQVGSLWINDASRFRLDSYPFGGVGASGFGREGVRYAMEELSQWKFTGMRLSPQ